LPAPALAGAGAFVNGRRIDWSAVSWRGDLPRALAGFVKRPQAACSNRR